MSAISSTFANSGGIGAPIPVLVPAHMQYAGAGGHATRLLGTAMGTECVITVCADDTETSQLLADVAWRTLLDYDRAWSRFRPDSELSRLNSSHSDTDTCIEVSDDLAVLLDAMLWAYHYSAGLVDACVLPDLLAAGYDRDYSLLAAAQPTHREVDLQPAAAPVRSHRSTLSDCSLSGGPGEQPGQPGEHPGQQTQVLNRPVGLLLDSGGIGKGLAADLIGEAVSQAGASGVVINLGGDVRAIGHDHNGKDHVVEVGDERSIGSMPVQPLASWTCSDHGVATSSIARRRLPRGHHLIDPRTGLPSRSDLLAVSVRHDRALDAEVAAKTVLLLGRERGERWLVAREFEAILTTRTGSVIEVPNQAPPAVGRTERVTQLPHR